jgi:predicted permease
MLATLTVVLPIFALILAGWIARRIGVLGAHATSELNRFVVYLALPALLFDVIAHASWADLWLPGFIAAFGLSSLGVFALTAALRLRLGRALPDAAIDGLNAGYANTGFVGFPLAVVALGPRALAPTTIATIITACALFAIAIVLIELGLHTGLSRTRLAGKVGGSLLRNPLLVAPVLGALFPLSGLAVPPAIGTFLKLLGGAASPCALVTLGLFLAERRYVRDSQPRAVALFVALKLLVQPAAAWLLAHLFALPASLAHIAVLLAALPTGTGPFMLAEFYRREAAVTSRVILVSTVLSVLTVAGYLALVR